MSIRNVKTYKDTMTIGGSMPVRLAVVISVFLFAGCAGIGPPTLDRDRFDYVSAISESWKRQTLLNLVKIRYLDAPVFMDVASVISQYALEGEIMLGAEWEDTSMQTIEGRAMYTDRPTISYAPLTGANYARSLMRPIPVSSTLLLIQSGYPIDYVLRICIQGINGLDNRSGGMAAQSWNPEFFELMSLLRYIQQKDGLMVRTRIIDGKPAVVLHFREPDTGEEAGILTRVLDLLGVNPDKREFRIVHGYLAETDTEIAMVNRSMMQIMTDYASYITVPDADITEGRVYQAAPEQNETGGELPFLIRVRCSTSKPEDAFISVFYRNHWYFIDDRDIWSKRTFYFLMLMFSFTERSDNAQAMPVLTVPTN